MMRGALIALTMSLSNWVLLQIETAAASPPEALEVGKVLPEIRCAAHPEQSYALYLPSNYTPDRAWPVVVSSDPGAHGATPLELQQDAAERLGYILVSSNNSQNGPAKPRLEATSAMLLDVQARLSIDRQRVYFAGFSGGARFSSQVATLCKCAAGVLLSGAGFSGDLPPSPDSAFPVFSTVGTLDFNYSEVIPLQDALAKTGHPHWLRIFEGHHQWARAEVMEEALAWFRIQAIKAQRDPSDPNFIQAQFSKAQARAQTFEQAGDLLAAWREYGQIVATYESLVDVGSLRAKARTLGNEKAVREASKREQNEFQEQAQLKRDFSTRLFAPLSADEDRAASDQTLQAQIVHLRRNADQEKRPERARVFQRALGDVFVTSMESGNSLLEEKKVVEALRLYGFATQAQPDSAWAWRQLATARALAGKKKDAIDALHRAQDLAAYRESFKKWLETEAALDGLRGTPEFQELLK